MFEKYQWTYLYFNFFIVSIERISNLFEKFTSTLNYGHIYIYRYRYICLFSALPIQNYHFQSRKNNNILNSYIKYWNQNLKLNWKTKQIIIESWYNFTSTFYVKQKWNRNFISRRKKCQTIVDTITYVRQFDIFLMPNDIEICNELKLKLNLVSHFFLMLFYIQKLFVFIISVSNRVCFRQQYCSRTHSDTMELIK